MTTPRESTPYGPSGMQGPVPRCAFSLPPAPSSSLGKGTRGHLSAWTGRSFAMSLSLSLSGRSCTEPGAAAPARLPPPLGSAAVGAARPASESPRVPARPPLGRSLDVRFRFRWIGLACSPESWERLRLGRREARGSRRPPRGRGPQDARMGEGRPYSRSAAVSSRGAT